MATDTDPMASMQRRLDKLEKLEEAVGQTGTFQQNEDGTWTPAIPLPYYYGLREFLWKRITGWRDEYGRAAQLFWE